MHYCHLMVRKLQNAAAAHLQQAHLCQLLHKLLEEELHHLTSDRHERAACLRLFGLLSAASFLPRHLPPHLCGATIKIMSGFSLISRRSTSFVTTD